MLYKCVMRPFPAALVIAGALLASIGCAGAAVVINVDKTTIVVSGSNPPGHREVEEAEARPRAPRYAPPGTWWGYNRPYSGDGRWSYPNPSPRGWYGGSFGY